MGKQKHDKFINPNKAIHLKLVSRDMQDETNNNKPLFQVVAYPMDDRLTAEERQRRDRLISKFDDTALMEEQAREQYEQERQKQDENFEYRQAKNDAYELVKGKQNLWIHSLQQLKDKDKIKEALMEGGEFEDVQIEEKEEYEEDYDENEDYGDEEEEKHDDEEDDDDDEEEEKNQNKKKYITLQEYLNSKRTEVEGQEISDETKKRIIEEYEKQAEEMFQYDKIDYDKIKISKNVRMKKFDALGFPVDKYNYYQHIFDNKPKEGNLVAVINQTEKIEGKEDVDYEYEEMTEEQKELQDAYEGEGYEELEDDFIAMMQKDQEDKLVEQKEQEKTVQNKDNKKKNKQQKKKVDFTIQQQPGENVIFIDDKNEEEQLMKGEKAIEEIIDEEEFDEEEFKNAMDMYEDCDQQQEQYEKIDQKEFGNILDEHIQDIEQRQKSLKQEQMEDRINLLKRIELLQQRQQEREKQSQDKDDPFGVLKKHEKTSKVVPGQYAYNYLQRLREEREVRPDLRDEIWQAKKDKFGDELLGKQHVNPLSLEEDTALNNYIMRTEEEEEKMDKLLDEKFDKLIQPRALDETIATKSFSKSTVHEHLNVIQEQGNKKKSKASKMKDDEENPEISKIDENNSDEENEDENMDTLNDVSSIYQKRDKNETEEERKMRKKLIKEFNKQRKEQKRAFKQGFENLTNSKQLKLNKQNGASQNLRGVKVAKM